VSILSHGWRLKPAGSCQRTPTPAIPSIPIIGASGKVDERFFQRKGASGVKRRWAKPWGCNPMAWRTSDFRMSRFGASHGFSSKPFLIGKLYESGEVVRPITQELTRREHIKQVAAKGDRLHEIPRGAAARAIHSSGLPFFGPWRYEIRASNQRMGSENLGFAFLRGLATIRPAAARRCRWQLVLQSFLFSMRNVFSTRGELKESFQC